MSETIKEMIENESLPVKMDGWTPKHLGLIKELCTEAIAQQVTNGIEADEAAGYRNNIKALEKALYKSKRAILKPLEEKVKAVRKFFSIPEAMLTKTDETLEGRMLDFVKKQREDQLARERAEEERIRKEKLDAAREIAAQAVAVGNTAAAEAAIEAALTEPVTVTVLDADLPKGITQHWKHEVTDRSLFIAWAAQNNLDLLAPNDEMLAYVAKQWKGEKTIPGVKFYPEESISRRG